MPVDCPLGPSAHCTAVREAVPCGGRNGPLASPRSGGKSPSRPNQHSTQYLLPYLSRSSSKIPRKTASLPKAATTGPAAGNWIPQVSAADHRLGPRLPHRSGSCSSTFRESTSSSCCRAYTSSSASAPSTLTKPCCCSICAAFVAALCSPASTASEFQLTEFSAADRFTRWGSVGVTSMSVRSGWFQSWGSLHASSGRPSCTGTHCPSAPLSYTMPSNYAMARISPCRRQAGHSPRTANSPDAKS